MAQTVGGRLLLVEDDHDLSAVLGELLTMEGHRVDVVDNGRAALDYLARPDLPDVILLDLRMPVMNGWQFRVEQRRNPELARIPVIVISADDSAQAAAVDAEFHLDKPVDMDGLFAAVRVALERGARRNAEARLANTERMASLGTLAAGVAHEINNPLTYVLMNLERLRARLGDTEEGKWVREALDGAERIQRIVADIKSFSRPDDEQLVLVDLRDVLEAALSLVRNELRQRARVETEYGLERSVWASSGRLGQVFLNLLVNAFQSIPEGNSSANVIRVRVSTELGARVVEISDTGTGIPEALRRRIFEPFFTTKPIGVGTGLGLSICHGIVRRLGGRIDVESEPGRGSTFRVVLPVPDAVPERRAAAVVAPAPRGPRRRVLVVDDEPMLGRAIGSMLGTRHDVVVASSAAEARGRLDEDEDFDLILCDLHMPGISGVELYQFIVEGHPTLAERIVFMTGGAFTPKVREFIATVQPRCIEKPFTAKALEALVEELPSGVSAPDRERS